MTIPASFQIAPLQQSSRSVKFVDAGGMLTQEGKGAQDAVYNFVNGCCRIIPCNVTGTNALTLTMLSNAPLVKQYSDFDTFRFVAANTSTGSMTATVVTPQGTLTALGIYKANGALQAGAGDVVQNLQYDLTFCDALNVGAGGFVLR